MSNEPLRVKWSPQVIMAWLRDVLNEHRMTSFSFYIRHLVVHALISKN